MIKLHCELSITRFCKVRIGHVTEYPTMHYFRVSRQTQSMRAYTILTGNIWKSGYFSENLHCGNFGNMPYS